MGPTLQNQAAGAIPQTRIDRLVSPRGGAAWAVALILATLLGMGGVVVWRTGGTHLSYLHILYLPVILAGAAFNLRGGLIAGLAAGLIVGPMMPLDTAQGLSQPVESWALRILYFVAVGAVVGALSAWLKGLLRTVEARGMLDGLTGLPTTAYLADWFESPEADDRRPFALIVLDLRRFRDVNAALGRDASDRILARLAKRVTRVLAEREPSGLIVRGAGARFVLVSESRLPQTVSALVEACHAQLSRPLHVEEVPIRIESHAGVAFCPGDAESMGDLLRAAEVAADFAADRARSLVFYEPSQALTDPARLRLLADLHRAIERDGLALHYQPKIAAHTGRIVGAEALIRWPREEGGHVPPGDFMPLLAGTLLEVKLTSWVLRRAFEQAARWERAGRRLTVAVNIPPSALQHDALFEELEELLAEHAVPVERIELEVTEDAVFADVERADAALMRLAARGFRIAIDDFGTGFSSLDRLRRLPVSTLKIDKSFVQTLPGAEQDLQIVKMCVAIAGALGVESVAEGVESEEAAALLADLGCTLLQGFHLGRPAPADALQAPSADRSPPRPDPSADAPGR